MTAARLVLPALGALLLATALRAQVPPLIFRELSDDDVAALDLHDGALFDWLDVVGEPAATAKDFRVLAGRPYDPADFEFRLWLAWHDRSDRLYIAVEFFDDDYIYDFEPLNIRGNSMYGQDGSIAIELDADISGGGRKHSNPDQYATRADWLLDFNRGTQYYAAIAEATDGGSHVALRRLDRGWWGLPPYADGSGGRFGEQPVVTSLEIYLTPFDSFLWDDPENSVVHDLRPGDLIDFRIAIVDRIAELEWTEFVFAGNRGLLLPRDASDDAPTDEVVPSTWAGVKQVVPVPVDSAGKP